MTDREPSPNAFEQDKPGTPARDRSEDRIEGVRDLGGVFVEAVRATRLPMVLTDPALPGDPIVFANKAFLDLSGYAMHEVLGQSPHFMNGPDTDPEDVARFLQILADDEDGTVETIQYDKDGRRFVATVLLSAFKDELGRSVHHFLTWADVTRRVDAEDDAADLRTTQAALRESEAKYRTLFEEMDEGFALCELARDASGRAVDFRYLELNSALRRHVGVDPETLRGRLATEAFPERDPWYAETYARVVETGESVLTEHHFPTSTDGCASTPSRAAATGLRSSTATSPSRSARKPRCARARRGRRSCCASPTRYAPRRANRR